MVACCRSVAISLEEIEFTSLKDKLMVVSKPMWLSSPGTQISKGETGSALADFLSPLSAYTNPILFI